MEKSKRPDPSLLFETLNAYQRTEALKAALELDVFSHLAERPLSSAELAKSLEASERGVRILSDYLCIIGFLEKENGRYQLTPSSALFLVKSSPTYLGMAEKFMASKTIVSSFSELSSTVRTGRTSLPEDGTVSPDNPVWVDFAEAMGAMMSFPARGMVAVCGHEAETPLRVLDVAAGHGEFGFAFARKFPKSEVFALDWDAVLRFTKTKATQYGLEKQMRYIPGDAFQVELPKELDLILIPNFLHHFSKEDCIRFLKRIRSALKEGGEVMILEFIPNEDRISPAGSAAFALTMLATTRDGDAYTFEDYKRMLNEAGYPSAVFEKLEAGMEGLVRAKREEV